MISFTNSDHSAVGFWKENNDSVIVCFTGRKVFLGDYSVMFDAGKDTLLFAVRSLDSLSCELTPLCDTYKGLPVYSCNRPIQGYYVSLFYDEDLIWRYAEYSDEMDIVNALYQIELTPLFSNEWKEWKKGMKETPPESLSQFFKLLDLELIWQFYPYLQKNTKPDQYPIRSIRRLPHSINESYVFVSFDDYPDLLLFFKTDLLYEEWKSITQYPVVAYSKTLPGSISYNNNGVSWGRVTRPLFKKDKYQLISYDGGYLLFVDESKSSAVPDEESLSELISISNSILF